MVNPNRIREINQGIANAGPIVYWMSRDQRVEDNWALLYAKQLADKFKSPLAVVFNLVPEFLEATIRQYGFMIKGLMQVERDLRKLNIPIFLLTGEPENTIPTFMKKYKAGVLVADFTPLRISQQWKKQVASKINIPFDEVDAHNIIPAWETSNKQEYAAYTIRPKIHRRLQDYLEDFPSLKKHKYPWPMMIDNINWTKARKSLQLDKPIGEVAWLKPGEHAAANAMYDFLENRLVNYNKFRNNPNYNAQSNLSPYLHFGQLSAQRLARETQNHDKDFTSQEEFLEELIVRRELSDNYCLYNANYDNFDGFPIWAQETLNIHRKDKREYIYDLKNFEVANTHDDLWNAAQREMTLTGKMHGYMRMYWAKKILEWSASPEDAQKTAIYLNDKYSLDGRDPNGYTGIAWSIGGVHDRAWTERKVFGKIRYMNYNGCKRKFDIKGYIEKIRHMEADLKL